MFKSSLAHLLLPVYTQADLSSSALRSPLRLRSLPQGFSLKCGDWRLQRSWESGSPFPSLEVKVRWMMSLWSTSQVSRLHVTIERRGRPHLHFQTKSEKAVELYPRARLSLGGPGWNCQEGDSILGERDRRNDLFVLFPSGLASMVCLLRVFI